MENLTICCSFIPADRLCFRFLTRELGFLDQTGGACIEVDGKQIQLLYLSINALKYAERAALNRSNPCQGSAIMSGNMSWFLRTTSQLADFKPILHTESLFRDYTVICNYFYKRYIEFNIFT